MPKVIDKEVLLTLKKRKQELLKEIAKIDTAIIAFNGGTSPIEISWTTQALACIKQFDEFVQTNDVLKCLFWDKKEALENPLRKRNYLVALSIALNKLVANKKLEKCSFAGVKGYYYGYPEWAHAGIPKEEYMSKLEKRIYGESIAV